MRDLTGTVTIVTVTAKERAYHRKKPVNHFFVETHGSASLRYNELHFTIIIFAAFTNCY